MKQVGIDGDCVGFRVSRRKGFIYNEDGIGYLAGSKPSIQWGHIDGPLLYCRDGQMHWLTLWERIQCKPGMADELILERKHWPDVVEREDAIQFGGG